MKISLIVPPSPFLINERVFPNLGVLYVAAALRRTGHNVEVIDLTGGGELPDIAADIYGVTAVSAQVDEALDVLRQLRKMGKRPVIIGGAHATVAPKHCLEMGFDAVIKGEMDNFKAFVTEIKSFVTEVDEQVVFDAFSPEDLDSIPFPARDLIDIHSYNYYLDGKKTTSIISSRGCPYRCAFCCKTFPRDVRFRSAQNVLDEARHLKEIGFDGLQFYDDELLIYRRRDLEIFSGLKRLGMVYRCFTRANLIDDTTAHIMAETGCIEILIGIESGSNRILRNVNKGTTREQNLWAINLLKKRGIRVKTAIIIGLPGENTESIEETESFIKEAQPDDIDFSILSIYPGSDIYMHPQNYDVHFQKDGYLPFKSKPGEYVSGVSTSAMSAEEIVKARDYLERRFKRKELLR